MTCHLVYFTVQADHKVKIKESKKRDKYMDLAGKLKKKLWIMAVTVIPIVVVVFGTVSISLERWIEEKLEISVHIEITALLRSARIL